MHVLRKVAAVLMLPAALALAACGSGDDQPPLDEMTLRDVLLADPTVVAHLAKDARDHLRTRFTDQRLAPDVVTEVTVSSDMPLLNQVVTMDASRFHAGRDAMIAGAWQMTNTGAEALPFYGAVGTKPQNPLPALGGDLSGDTLLAAESALEGPAGAIVEALMASSGATKIERVTVWPIGALATADTVYVNGSWLVAMDERATGCGSGGGSSGGSKTAPAGPPQNGLYGYLVNSSGQGSAGTGTSGDGTEGTEGGIGTIEGQNHASGSDFCSSSSSSCSSAANNCSSASNNCSNSANNCSNSANSCSNSSNSCSSSSSSGCDPADRECCRSCSMSHRRPPSVVPQSPIMALASMFWLLAPLGFLLAREKGAGARLRKLMNQQRKRPQADGLAS